MKRRILASLLSLLLVFSLVPTAVFASEGADVAIQAAQTEDAGEPQDVPAEEPEEEAQDDPTEESEEEALDNPAEEPQDDPTEEPEGEPQDDPTEEPEEDAQDDPTEEPAEEAQDDPEGGSEENVRVQAQSKADEEDATVQAAEAAVAQIGDDSSKTYSTLAAAIAAANNGETVTLLDDVTESVTIASGTTITLDLAGHTLAGTGNSSVITVKGNLTLKDGSTAGTGKVTGGSTSNGGGVMVYGFFTLTSGTISGNTASTYGGGVHIRSGSFTMSGGTISGNTASGYGGGVYVNSSCTFEMSGGTISGNTTTSNGGGVFVYGALTMTDGTISGNKATSSGGGVYVASYGTLTMSGGEISENAASTSGGGVFVYKSSTFTMSDGAISKNKARNGGGVYVDSSSSVTGSFTMEDGTISSNTASTNGGGVYVGGAMNVSGTPVVSGNTLSDGTTTNNVYLPSRAYITLDGELTDGASIGVTTKDVPTANKAVEITTAEESTAYYSVSLSFFFSDNTDYTVRVNTTGKYLELFRSTLYESDFEVDTNAEPYTGSAITKTVTSSLTEGTDYTVAYSANVNVGTATITITGQGNYTGTLTYQFTINKATQTLVPESYSVTKTYGDADFVNEITGAMTTLYYSSGDTDVATVGLNDGTVTIVGAGTTNIAVFAMGYPNYTDASVIYTLTVEPATPVVSLAGAESKTYDGQPVSDPTISVTLVNGDTDYTQTITYYAVADDRTETELTGAPSEAGSYKVVVTVDAGSNYNTVTAEAAFTITEAEQSVTVEGFTDVVYDGQPHEVTVTADADATVTVTYTDANGNTVAAPVNVGTYTAHVTVTRENYTTVEQDVVASIVQAAQAISYDTTSVTKTEGDDPFTNPLTQTTVFCVVTYASSDESVATVDANGQVTIVGAGTATITATAAGTDNYTEATASYTLTVEEAVVVSDDDDSSCSGSSKTSSGSSKSSGSGSGTSTSTTTSPKTGDEAKVLLWLTLTVLAAFALIVTVIYSKMRRNEP